MKRGSIQIDDGTRILYSGLRAKAACCPNCFNVRTLKAAILTEQRGLNREPTSVEFEDAGRMTGIDFNEEVIVAVLSVLKLGPKEELDEGGWGGEEE